MTSYYLVYFNLLSQSIYHFFFLIGFAFLIKQAMVHPKSSKSRNILLFIGIFGIILLLLNAFFGPILSKTPPNLVWLYFYYGDSSPSIAWFLIAIGYFALGMIDEENYGSYLKRAGIILLVWNIANYIFILTNIASMTIGFILRYILSFIFCFAAYSQIYRSGNFLFSKSLNYAALIFFIPIISDTLNLLINLLFEFGFGSNALYYLIPGLATLFIFVIGVIRIHSKDYRLAGYRGQSQTFQSKEFYHT